MSLTHIPYNKNDENTKDKKIAVLNYTHKLWNMIHQLDDTLPAEFHLNFINQVFSSLAFNLNKCECSMSGREIYSYILMELPYSLSKIKKFEDGVNKCLDSTSELEDAILKDNYSFDVFFNTEYYFKSNNSMYENNNQKQHYQNKIALIDDLHLFYNLFHDEVNFKLGKNIYTSKLN